VTGLESVAASRSGLFVVKEVVPGGSVGREGGGCCFATEVSVGTLRRVTSILSRGFVPLPGMKTRVDPLLCEEEPTAIPNSALGPYFQGRSVGGIVETGHPKGNR